MLDRSAFVQCLRRWREKREEPNGRIYRIAQAIDGPSIGPAVRMDRRRRHDVAAMPANIEALPELTGAASDRHSAVEVGQPEIQVAPAASRDDLARGGQRAHAALDLG